MMPTLFSKLLKSKAFAAQFIYGLICVAAAGFHRSVMGEPSYVDSANLIIMLNGILMLLLLIKIPIILILLFMKRWQGLKTTCATALMLLIFIIIVMIVDAPTIIYAT